MFLFNNDKGYLSCTEDSTPYYLGKSPEELITKLEESSGTIFECTKNICKSIFRWFQILIIIRCKRSFVANTG